jgi:hypothetical protein
MEDQKEDKESLRLAYRFCSPVSGLLHGQSKPISGQKDLHTSHPARLQNS